MMCLFKREKMGSCYVNLNCLVYGEFYKNSFPVKINVNETIGELKRLIKSENCEFVTFGASNLRLWKVDIPLGRNSSAKPDLLDVNELVAVKEIKEYWNSLYPIKGNLHVIIKTPQIVQPTITLNCLIIPNASPESLSVHNVTVLEIPNYKKVDQLRYMIMNRWPTLFENILPSGFILRKVYKESDTTNLSDQIKSYKDGSGGVGGVGKEMIPYNLISEYFNLQPISDGIHIIVRIQAPQ